MEREVTKEEAKRYYDMGYEILMGDLTLPHDAGLGSWTKRIMNCSFEEAVRIHENYNFEHIQTKYYIVVI